MILAQVDKEDLAEAWPVALPLLLSAIEQGEEDSPESVLGACEQGEMQLWLIATNNNQLVAAGTTRLVRHKEETHCHVLHLGGVDMRTWGKEITDTLAQWAKEAGCTKLLCQGRKGTERMYKDFGWEFDSVRLKRVL